MLNFKKEEKLMYELKARKWLCIFFMFFMTAVFFTATALMIDIASYDPMAEVGLTPIPGEYYPVTEKSIFDEPLYLLGIAMVFVLTVCTYVFGIIALRRKLLFDNTKFIVNGVTYTYDQIEKVHFRVHRRFARRSFRVSKNIFEIVINGENVFTYDEFFSGYKEFHYYLDYYKVTVTPR